MAKDPRKRYQSGEEMAAALRASVPELAGVQRDARPRPAVAPVHPATPAPSRRRYDAPSAKTPGRGVLRPLLRLAFVAAGVAVGAAAFFLASEDGRIELPQIGWPFDGGGEPGEAPGRGVALNEEIAVRSVGPFPGNGHFYMAVRPGVERTWHEAKTAAESTVFGGVSGHLATFTSEEEFEWFVEEASWPNEQAWIGGFKTIRGQGPDSEWRWVTGEPWSFTSWTDDEPNSPWTGENVYLTFWPGDENWRDEGQGIRLREYIVEFPVGESLVASARDSGIGRTNTEGSVRDDEGDVASSGPAAGPTERPSRVKLVEGDWTVTGEETFEDTILQVRGQIVVAGTGSLRLENSWLVFDPSASQAAIEVRGGELSLDGSQLRIGDLQGQRSERFIAIGVAGGLVAFKDSNFSTPLAVETKDAQVEITGSSLSNSTVVLHNGELSLKDSGISDLRLMGGDHELIESKVGFLEFSPTARLRIVDSVLSTFNLQIPESSAYLVAGLSGTEDARPEIVDLGSSAVSSLDMDGTKVRDGSWRSATGP